MMERRVVLFGGSGFVGRHLAPRLANQGWTVRVASRHPRPEAASPAGDVRAVTDLGDEDQVRRAVTGAKAVINLVGIAREREASFEAVHVAGAARVARLAATAGVRRLLHVSALGIAEDAPAAADRTKARGEVAVRAAFPAVTLVRPSLIYGPGDHFFTRFTALAKVSPVLPVIGGGRTRFQPLHVDDAIQTMLTLLERPETAGTTLALVGSETFASSWSECSGCWAGGGSSCRCRSRWRRRSQPAWSGCRVRRSPGRRSGCFGPTRWQAGCRRQRSSASRRGHSTKASRPPFMRSVDMALRHVRSDPGGTAVGARAPDVGQNQ
jgi:uncharacterized protein YbjT (DUF2867 family)